MRSSMRYFFPVLLLAILFFVDWYVFQGVKTLTSDMQFSTWVKIGYWIFSGSIIALLPYALYVRFSKGKFNPFSRIMAHAFLIVMVTKLVFLTVLFAEDIYRVAATVVHSYTLPGDAAWIPHRMKFVSQLGMFLAGIPFISLVYGVAKGKYNYRVHKHTVYYDDLPEAFEGFTITQISDIHSGSFRNPAAVQKGIDLINQQKSDLFVFTGDLVNNLASEVEPWIGHFSQIAAPYGKFAILGNHDYGDYVAWKSAEDKWQNLQRLKEHHITLGHRLLLNEHVTINKDGQKITLAGVENWGQGFTKQGDLEKTLRQVDKDSFKILLSHDPSHWDMQVKDHAVDIHLTLSGHTHGMQFGIEIPGFKWSPVKYRYPNWAGLVKHKKRHLHVNRGFGFIGFEGRVGIWPEITVIELRRSKS